MPWSVGKRTEKGWPIIKDSTGEIVGYSNSKEEAKAAVRARYANSRERRLE